MARKSSQRFEGEEEVELADGELVFAQGDESRELYIVQSGQVVVTRESGRERLVLATLGRGAVFGEMAMLESKARSATAHAKGPTRLVVVPPGGLLLKIRRDPTLAFEMLQQFSRRLRIANDWIASATQGIQGGATVIRESPDLEFHDSLTSELIDDDPRDAPP